GADRRRAACPGGTAPAVPLRPGSGGGTGRSGGRVRRRGGRQPGRPRDRLRLRGPGHTHAVRPVPGGTRDPAVLAETAPGSGPGRRGRSAGDCETGIAAGPRVAPATPPVYRRSTADRGPHPDRRRPDRPAVPPLLGVPLRRHHAPARRKILHLPGSKILPTRDKILPPPGRRDPPTSRGQDPPNFREIGRILGPHRPFSLNLGGSWN